MVLFSDDTKALFTAVLVSTLGAFGTAGCRNDETESSQTQFTVTDGRPNNQPTRYNPITVDRKTYIQGDKVKLGGAWRTLCAGGITVTGENHPFSTLPGQENNFMKSSTIYPFPAGMFLCESWATLNSQGRCGVEPKERIWVNCISDARVEQAKQKGYWDGTTYTGPWNWR